MADRTVAEVVAEKFERAVLAVSPARVGASGKACATKGLRHGGDWSELKTFDIVLASFDDHAAAIATELKSERAITLRACFGKHITSLTVGDCVSND